MILLSHLLGCGIICLIHVIYTCTTVRILLIGFSVIIIIIIRIYFNRPELILSRGCGLAAQSWSQTSSPCCILMNFVSVKRILLIVRNLLDSINVFFILFI